MDSPIINEKGRAVFRKIRILLLILVFPFIVNAQDVVSDEQLKMGLKQLQEGENEDAARIFLDVLSQLESETIHPEALYWLVKADILLDSYAEAAAAADRFLIDFPGHKYQNEMQYQRARLLYLEGEPEKAVTALGTFISKNPQSPFAASALYWIGESLTSLGRLEEADVVFSELLEKYPASVKREAARFRRSELSQLYRERELLNLLKWSHEEYLRDIQEFYRREAELLELRSNLTRTEQQEMLTGQLLEIKSDLLFLQSYYINELVRLSDAD